jgi:DnaK suppressor protein
MPAARRSSSSRGGLKSAGDTGEDVAGSDTDSGEVVAAPEAAPAKPKRTRRRVSSAGATGSKADASSSPSEGSAPEPTEDATTEPAEYFLAVQRHLLTSERATLLEQVDMLKAEAEAIVEDMEPGDVQFDDESGEGGTMTVDRERDLLLSAQAMEAVEEVDHALAKLDAGSYGICEHCGEMIGRERLRALPYARLCLRCKTPGLSRR